MNLPSVRVIVEWSIKILVLVAILVGSYKFYQLNARNITYAVTHSNEVATCRVNTEKALSNPLLQPVINSK